MVSLSLEQYALISSAEKWIDNFRKGLFGALLGAKGCACCRLWLQEECQGCPVSEFARKNSCRGTPYEDVRSANMQADKKAFEDAAFREYMFLLALADGDEDWARYWCYTKNTSNATRRQENKRTRPCL